MPSAYCFNQGFWPLCYLRNEALDMIWPRVERFTTFEFHLWNCFCVGEWILAIWNCLHACVHLCVCILALEAETGRGALVFPESTGPEGAMTRTTESLTWVWGGLCFSQEAVAYFPSSEIASIISHLHKLLSRRWPAFLTLQPFNQTGLYFCFSSLCKVTPGSRTLSAAVHSLLSLLCSNSLGLFPA